MNINSSSSSTNDISNLIICKLCNKQFTKRGINIHLARSHASQSQDSIINTTEYIKNGIDSKQDSELHPVIQQDSSSDSVQCSHCGCSYSSAHGVKIHISKAHPDKHRQKILSNYEKDYKNCGIVSENSTNTPKKFFTENNTLPIEFSKKMMEWRDKFLEDMNNDEFGINVDAWIEFLATSIDLLPGPKHPARKYYEYRKTKNNTDNQRKYKQTTNPERETKRDRIKRREKYKYQLTQYHYFNQRRKAVRTVLKSNSEMCKISIDEIYSYFSEMYTKPNQMVRPNYPSLTDSERIEIDDMFEDLITKKEIEVAINNIAIDTSPGPDHVIVRIIKNTIAAEIIASISTRMLQTGYVPSKLKQARTILIHKGNDSTDIANWRPITICSVIRRVIDRVLDKHIREFVSFNPNQRGFTNSSGAHINTAILDSLLHEAKTKKTDLSVIFLDIRKAFDNVGHAHLRNTLKALPIPTKLVDLVLNLQTENITRIQSQNSKTKPMKIIRGVLQGSPLSPTLFNLSVDHILNELSENSVSTKYGVSLNPNQNHLSVMGFADDIAIIGKNNHSASILCNHAIQQLKEIGLEININKCKIICIEKGNLFEGHCKISPEDTLPSLKKDEFIRYLGVNFNDEINFDPLSTLRKVKSSLELLIASPLLQADQKFNVLNSSICPSLIYTFQTTSPNKISHKFITDLDIMIRGALKEILQLPNDLPNDMIYSDTKFKGLGLFCSAWEMHLQYVNKCKILLQSDIPFLHATKPLSQEISSCLAALNVKESDNILDKRGFVNTKKVRQQLREMAFENWTKKEHKGKGVLLYKQYTPANKWIKQHKGLTCNEWREAIKMTANISAVRSVPGRSQNSNLCRRCHREFETLAHVLGACPHGELLRNARHHTIRSLIANALKNKGYTVFEEVHGISSAGSTRRIDIIAMKPPSREGYIIDPTIRFERDEHQPEEVDAEKKLIYEPTIDFYKDKYHLESITITGLMVGARGTIPKFVVDYCKTFGLHKEILIDISIAALKGSIAIFRNHTYHP